MMALLQLINGFPQVSGQIEAKTFLLEFLKLFSQRSQFIKGLGLYSRMKKCLQTSLYCITSNEQLVEDSPCIIWADPGFLLPFIYNV
jgi:hypothetical protein